MSAEVAAALAHGVRARLLADVGVGVTGSTGDAPEGQPPGLTFVAVASPSGCTVRRYTDDHGPGRNDERAVRMALKLVDDVLHGCTGDDHEVAIDDERLRPFRS